MEIHLCVPEVDDGGGVRAVEHWTLSLDLQIAFHHSGGIVPCTDGEHQFAVYSLVIAKCRVGPFGSVHVVGDGLLELLEDFFTSVSYLVGVDFHFTIQFGGFFISNCAEGEQQRSDDE